MVLINLILATILLIFPLLCASNPTKAELNQIWDIVQKFETPYCPSTGGNVSYANHMLSYIAETPQYKQLSLYERKQRGEDNFDVEWAKAFCPEVYEYFSSRVRYFDYSSKENELFLTNTAGLAAVCMLKVIDITARHLNISWVLLAGSHLGAALHGGPIPWDDDIDIMIDYEHKTRFLNYMQGLQMNGKAFTVRHMHNCIKMWVKDDKGYPRAKRGWRWPFIDIFSMQKAKHTFANGTVIEAVFEHMRHRKLEENEKLDAIGSDQEYAERSILDNIERRHLKKHALGSKVWSFAEFYPLEEHFFGGLKVLTPNTKVLEKHYATDECIAGQWSHRLEARSPHTDTIFRIDCCPLSEYLPFQHRYISNSDSNVQLEVVMQGRHPIHLSRRSISSGQLLTEGYLSIIAVPEVHSGSDAVAWWKQFDTRNAYVTVTHSVHSRNSTVLLSFGARKQYVNPAATAQNVMPSVAFETDYIKDIWGIDQDTLYKWGMKSSEGRIGRAHTASIPNLNQIEVHNLLPMPVGIGFRGSRGKEPFVYNVNDNSCTASSVESLKVVEFNAERGIKWLETAYKLQSDEDLKNADVIILNEMDIGMARSENLHTTRMLAYALNMNYAWGLEFVELTRGDKLEQANTKGLRNTYSLHGNAILSKCRITSGFILRDPLDLKFYSNKPTFSNAKGYEKRLGGRMGLFVYIAIPSISLQKRSNTSSDVEYANILVGAVHKIEKEQYVKITSAMNQDGVHGAILAGDQVPDICPGTQMIGVHGNKKGLKNSWPATCSSFGWTAGDIMCTSKHFKKLTDKMILPCYTANSTTLLSDHAIYAVKLQFVKQ